MAAPPSFGDTAPMPAAARMPAVSAPPPRRPSTLRRAAIFESPVRAVEVARREALRQAWVVPPQGRAYGRRDDDALVPAGTEGPAPALVALLLMLMPPLGVFAVWTSPRFDRDARWALTLTSCIFMAFVAAVVATLR